MQPVMYARVHNKVHDCIVVRFVTSSVKTRCDTGHTSIVLVYSPCTWPFSLLTKQVTTGSIQPSDSRTTLLQCDCQNTVRVRQQLVPNMTVICTAGGRKNTMRLPSYRTFCRLAFDKGFVADSCPTRCVQARAR